MTAHGFGTPPAARPTRHISRSCHKLSLIQQWLANYSEQFRLPASAEISRLIAEVQTTTKPLDGTTELERVIESIKSPWLDVGNELGSVQRLLGLQTIGELIAHEAGFEPAVAKTLRTSLGDWRDAITWPDEIWTDLSARADFYADLGFDMDLTDMPAPAFREAAAATTNLLPLSTTTSRRKPRRKPPTRQKSSPAPVRPTTGFKASRAKCIASSTAK